jgi:hypothetical protein
MTAEKRAQMVAANMARASALQLDDAFAILGRALPLDGSLALVSPAHQGQTRQRSLLAATVSAPWDDLERFESPPEHQRSALSLAVNSIRRRVASPESLPGTKLLLHTRWHPLHTRRTQQRGYETTPCPAIPKRSSRQTASQTPDTMH